MILCLLSKNTFKFWKDKDDFLLNNYHDERVKPIIFISCITVEGVKQLWKMLEAAFKVGLKGASFPQVYMQTQKVVERIFWEECMIRGLECEQGPQFLFGEHRVA